MRHVNINKYNMYNNHTIKIIHRTSRINLETITLIKFQRRKSGTKYAKMNNSWVNEALEIL